MDEIQEKINELVEQRIEKCGALVSLKQEIKGLQQGKKNIESDLDLIDRKLKHLLHGDEN